MTVEILGRNGIAGAKRDRLRRMGASRSLRSKRTSTKRKPVAYVARLGDDVSFIPYARDDRMLNFSRFDIDGVKKVLAEDLDAFVFTDRGVYRPGDEMHIGLVVKQRNWHGTPRRVCRSRPKWSTRAISRCKRRSSRCRPVGFAEVNYKTAYESPTGEYTDQRLPGEERQAFDAARLDHGEREGIPARSDEDRDAAFEDFAARLGRSARR